MWARQELDPRDPILAAVALRDDDAAVLAFASAVAEVCDAPITLVHAYPFEPVATLPAQPDWARQPAADAVGALEALAGQIRDGAPVGVVAKPNPSAVRVLHETAEELGASLIVAGSSRRGAVGRVVPGGVGERLLHAAPCSVAIAPRGYSARAGGLRRIGVAFRDGPEGVAALELAAGLAGRSGGRVTSFTVAGRFDVAGALERVRRTVPAELLTDTVVLDGEPAAALAAVSAALDLLVCGSRGYGPMRSLVLGGVSWELAHSARCPLLVLPRATPE